MSNIDHEYTDEIVCPYCGHEHEDSHEHFSRNKETTTTQCYECDKRFWATRMISVNYSTSELPCQNGESDHGWSKWEWFGDDHERRYCRACGEDETRKTGGAK